MRKQISILVTMVCGVLFCSQLASCRATGILADKVPYSELFDSARSINSPHFQLVNQRQYEKSGGITREEFNKNYALVKVLKSAEEKSVVKRKDFYARYLSVPMCNGNVNARYVLSDTEKIRIVLKFWDTDHSDSAGYTIPEAVVEKRAHNGMTYTIPLVISNPHFDVVKDPPLEYIFNCNFKYKRKWYSFYQHFDFGKNPDLEGHHTECELIQK
ncbi:MAG: hypothetical protein IJ559_08710 [Prevotella sp.]|nr:hypothetical protein [Prevotella sp.]